MTEVFMQMKEVESHSSWNGGWIYATCICIFPLLWGWVGKGRGGCVALLMMRKCSKFSSHEDNIGWKWFSLFNKNKIMGCLVWRKQPRLLPKMTSLSFFIFHSINGKSMFLIYFAYLNTPNHTWTWYRYFLQKAKKSWLADSFKLRASK